jgi:hypothetical protein
MQEVATLIIKIEMKGRGLNSKWISGVDVLDKSFNVSPLRRGKIIMGRVEVALVEMAVLLGVRVPHSWWHYWWMA